MRRTAVLSGWLVVLLLVVASMGQPTVGQQLQQLFLTQEELNDLSKELGLGEDWVVRTVDRLNPEPEGAEDRTAVATYVNTSSEIALIVGLLDFQSRELADRFLSAILTAKPVQSVRDLQLEARDNPDLLPEPLKPETDKVLLLFLEDGQQQLLLQRVSLVVFFRTSKDAPRALQEKELLQIANGQFAKILAFCKDAETKPAYCTRE
jgi:hypothetical protein